MNFHLDDLDIVKMPAGEFHPQLRSVYMAVFDDKANIYARINSADKLMKLITFTDAVRRAGYKTINLLTGYFPGGRQDRFSQGEALTCKVYADLINAQNYNKVEIVDPHSDVTTALLNNCVVSPVSHIIKRIVKENEYDTILIPDAGSAKKTYSYYFPDAEFNKKLNFIQCIKKRDTVTGKLSGFAVVDEIRIGARCLLCDDIVDGGGTFIGLAKEVVPYIENNYTPNVIGLYCTHGIFSKGITPLYDYYHEVYTTDSIQSLYKERVEVFPLYDTRPASDR